jgi:ABC-type polysaccharide transport system permease subunit
MRNLITGIRLAAALNRVSSDRLVSIAQRAIKNPKFISDEDVKSLAASVLSQAEPDRPMRDEGDGL